MNSNPKPNPNTLYQMVMVNVLHYTLHDSIGQSKWANRMGEDEDEKKNEDNN